jgi:hypothetical protein
MHGQEPMIAQLSSFIHFLDIQLKLGKKPMSFFRKTAPALRLALRTGDVKHSPRWFRLYCRLPHFAPPLTGCLTTSFVLLTTTLSFPFLLYMCHILRSISQAISALHYIARHEFAPDPSLSLPNAPLSFLSTAGYDIMPKVSKSRSQSRLCLSGRQTAQDKGTTLLRERPMCHQIASYSRESKRRP